MASSADYVRSIELPQNEMFRNLRNAKRFAIDIGGSLAKIAYLSEVEKIRPRLSSISCGTEMKVPSYTVEEQVERREQIHFVKFETKYIEDSLDFIQKNLTFDNVESKRRIKATGGGAHKFTKLMKAKLDVELEKLDEMQCLISGCNFLLSHVPNECFQFCQKDDKPEYIFKQLVGENIFPYLLVNIGSGVSIIKVESDEKFERIGGTSTGGGTFWGLGSLLTDAKGFDELLMMAMEGKTKNIDMLVKDIYGGAYAKLNLPGDLTASSFGKAARSTRDQSAHNSARFRSPDIAKALLQMVSNDIGQISSLYAQLHNLNRVFFGGYFIRGHPVTMHTISFAINFFSKGKLHALFLRHEGYLGAIGALLKTTTDTSDAFSWRENFAGSSAFSTNHYAKDPSPTVFGKFELDRVKFDYNVCPVLLDPSTYVADMIDLGADESAREYWLDVFENGIDAFVDKAIQSQCGQPDVEVRGGKFKEHFVKRLATLRAAPYAFGSLTIRSLLDTREQFLSAFSFCDPYLQIKQEENEKALSYFIERLQHLDQLDGSEKEIEILKGLLAGNMFDWGAKESVKYLDNMCFGFEDAKRRIQDRPWLIDGVDTWLARCQSAAHKLAVIFVDNSGADITLGVLPFARELLKRGTKVVLAANSYPAVNDVLYCELLIVCGRVAEICPIIRHLFYMFGEEMPLFTTGLLLCNALSEGTLKLMETGSSSPCLDLRLLEFKLVETMKSADLVVLEGMGRCCHTNFNARFSCEVIRCAVIKNLWLAKRMGGKLFDVIFKYTPPQC